MAFLNLLLAEALAAGLANRAESEEPQKPPPPNFFVLPKDPQAWRKFHEACIKENLVIAVEVTDNSKPNCRRVQPLFVNEAHKFESVPFVRVEIEFGQTYKELRDALGGVECTPTIIVVFFNNDGLEIGKVEGDMKIEGAIRTGQMERLMRTYMERRVRLKRVERLAEEFTSHVQTANRENLLKQAYEEDVKRQMEESERRERVLRETLLEEERKRKEAESKKKEEEIRQARSENVRKLLDLDLSVASTKDLKEIMKGMGISFGGIFEKGDLRKKLVQTVPELRMHLQSKLESLRKDEELIEQEMSDVELRLQEKRKSIHEVERDLKPL